jgi:hypothetical protein
MAAAPATVEAVAVIGIGRPLRRGGNAVNVRHRGAVAHRDHKHKTVHSEHLLQTGKYGQLQ